MLDDNELLRYSRQLLLPRFDVEGQLALKQARVLVVGSGGLGCPVALYLGAAGVGQLVLADDDAVELANLQRQIAFDQASVGRSKAEALAERVRAINPEISVTARVERLEGELLAEVVAGVDLVLDCTDNFNTRFALNRACVESRVPLVSGAAIRGEGQVSVFDSRDEASPCYHCLYPEQGNEDLFRGRGDRSAGGYDRCHPGHGGHQGDFRKGTTTGWPSSDPGCLADGMAGDETGPGSGLSGL